MWISGPMKCRGSGRFTKLGDEIRHLAKTFRSPDSFLCIVTGSMGTEESTAK